VDVAAFVAGRYGARATVPVPLGAGEWSRAYAFALDGEPVVGRFGAWGDDFAKDALLGALSTPRLPAPRVLDLGATPEGYFAVSQRRYGEFLDALDGPGMRAVLPALLATMDAIAAVTVEGSSGYGPWSPDRRAPHASWPEALLAVAADRPRIGDWRRALDASPVGGESFRLGHERLRRLAAELPDERRLVHADLLNRNVLVNGARVTAVLDWGNAMFGDPLYDAAWLLYWWPWYPRWSGIDVGAELARHRSARGCVSAGVDRRLLAYQLHIGLDHLAYTAATGRWDDLARNDAQVRALVRSG
jgi:hygromycin-B 4-O-kinase